MDQISCTTCAKRDLCTTLCPAALLYADQDQVEWSDTGVAHKEPRMGEDDADESIYADPDSGRLRVYDPVRGTDRPLLSNQERAVLSLLGQGKSRKQIRESLEISADNLKKVIRSLRTKWGRV